MVPKPGDNQSYCHSTNETLDTCKKRHASSRDRHLICHSCILIDGQHLHAYIMDDTLTQYSEQIIDGYHVAIYTPQTDK